MFQMNDVIYQYLKELRESVSNVSESGAFSESGSADSVSPEAVAFETGDSAVELSPNLNGVGTMSMSILEGATITGGSVVNYINLGDSTTQSLGTVTVSPTINTRGTALFNIPQISVVNIGKIVLKPNTQYVIEVTNTNVVADDFSLNAIIRRLV